MKDEFDQDDWTPKPKYERTPTFRQRVETEDLNLATAPKWDMTKGLYGNKEVVRAAKKLFFREYSPLAINLATGFPLSYLNRFVSKKKIGWRAQRDAWQEKYLEELTRSGKTLRSLTRIHGMGLAVIEKYLHRVLTREDELNIKDVKFLSDILANAHRMKQLESGQPTEIFTQRYEKMNTRELTKVTFELVRELNEVDGVVNYLEDNPRSNNEIAAIPIAISSVPVVEYDGE